MTNKMETIVRPFQAGRVFTAKSLPPPSVAFPAEEPSSSDDIVFTWGNPIQLLFSPIGITNLYGGAKLTEQSRTTSTVRVTNPEDETQFVDVERIETLRLLNPKTQELHEWTLNNS